MCCVYYSKIDKAAPLIQIKGAFNFWILFPHEIFSKKYFVAKSLKKKIEKGLAKF